MRIAPIVPLLLLLLAAPARPQPGSGSMGDANAIALIHQMEAGQRPASEIVSALVEDGRTVADATALVAGAARSPAIRANGTLYGMCLAVENDELSLDVGSAALQAAGGDDLDVARVVSAFREEQCQRFYPPPGGQSPAMRPVPVSPAD
jgi:hypothetical protein